MEILKNNETLKKCLRDNRLGEADKLICSLLVMFCNNENLSNCRPHVNTIAKCINETDNKIIRLGLRKLAYYGYIKIFRRTNGSTNIYQLREPFTDCRFFLP